ncbi:MAG: dihydropteroate synthase [Kiritimatiellia bacterium]|jgi:dihydropteroate synthase
MPDQKNFGLPVPADTLVWRCRGRILRLDGRPLIMGVLNATPDSFSDGGRFADPETAIAHGLQMVRDGADIIDVGGESTRPGAAPVPAEIESARILPVLRGLARQTACLLSVDTTKAAVAAPALDAGAHIINDISALTADPDMAELARRHGAGVVLMHRQGLPPAMQDNPRYEDVVCEVAAWLAERAAAAGAAGLDPQTLALDPGIGFGKTTRHILQLLANLPALARGAGERPLVVGLSRKSFLGEITGRDDPADRLPATVAGLAWAALAGAHVLRVHDVGAARDVLLVLQALQKERRAS